MTHSKRQSAGDIEVKETVFALRQSLHSFNKNHMSFLEDREDPGSKPVRAKSSQDPMSTIKAKLGGMYLSSIYMGKHK
jgi:hypothetical protein